MLSPRTAPIVLAGLLVATVAFAVVENGRLGDLLRHSGETEVPVVSTRACAPLDQARVQPELPPGFPTLDGVAFTGATRGYSERSVRDTHDAYVSALEEAGYTITQSQVDPWDSELTFSGHGRTGEIDVFQECRDRTWMQITVT